MPQLLSSPSVPAWYVVRTHPREELRSECNLQNGKIETFLPRMRARRARRQSHPAVLPLFPQYLFARFDPVESLHDVCFTRGVQTVLRVGAVLATVDDSAVEFLRARMDETGLIPVGEPLQPGERVVIEDGPFAQLIGVVERHLSDRERVTIFLSTVTTTFRLELPVESVRRLSSCV